MRKLVTLIVFAVLLPAGAEAQQRPGRAANRNPLAAAQQRAALERQIIRRFVQQSANAMKLDSQGRSHLERLLQESNGRRRELVLASADLRRRMGAAIRDPATGDGPFESLLQEAQELRRREHEIWQRDQDELSRTLTPRQRAIFVMHWIRLQEQIQALIDARDRGPTAVSPDTLQ